MIKAVGKPKEIMAFIEGFVRQYGKITLKELKEILDKELKTNEKN